MVTKILDTLSDSWVMLGAYYIGLTATLLYVFAHMVSDWIDSIVHKEK